MASSVATGSNAPVIMDDLVAWPPPPSIARFGGSGVLRQTRLSLINPLSSPPSQPSQPSSKAPSSTFPGASPLTGYANARTAPPPLTPKSPTRLGTSWNDEDDAISLLSPTKAESNRAYAPPRKPLSPQQLGRIAQSFGIVTPTLPEGPRSLTSSPTGKPHTRPPTQQSHHTHTRYTHSAAPSLSQHVVAVVPPVSLLPDEPGSDPAAEKDHVRRWRRGRLLPLQPTLGSMLVVIAREFGLPSTTGLRVYLGTSAGDAESDTDGGPQVTPATWTTLFGHGAVGHPISPQAGTESIRRFPRATQSPLTRVDEDGHTREKSVSSQPDMERSSLSSSSSYNSPRTPASVSLPAFGTIEFDVSPDATWVSGYRSGKRATEAEGGIKNLRLVDRLNDDRPKFLKDMANERERAVAASKAAQLAALEAARLSAAQRETVVKEQRVRRESELERQLERQRTRTMSQDSSGPPTRLSHHSPAPTPPRPAKSRARPSSTTEATGSSSGHSVDLAEQAIMEEPGSEDPGLTNTEEDLEMLTPLQSQLLSPIVTETFDGDRTSCVVMAHQLNHLEKMMKTLSPEDLRLTLTPGSPPASSLQSFTTGASVSPATASPGSLEPGEADGSRPPSDYGILPPRGSSRLPYLQPDHRVSAVSASTSTESSSPAPSPRRASDDPGERNSIATLNGQPRVRSTGPPPRPARPPTPDLSTPDLLEHVLPASYVDHLKSPVMSAVGARPASMSLKGLKRQLSVMRPESGIGEFGGYNAGAGGGSLGRAGGNSIAKNGGSRPPTQYGAYNDGFSTQRRTRRESEFGTSRISRLFGKKPSIDDTRRMTIIHLSSPVGTAPPGTAAPPPHLHQRQGSQTSPPVQLYPQQQGVGLSSAMTGLAGIPHSRSMSREHNVAPLTSIPRRGTPSDGTLSPTSPRSNYTRRKPVPGGGSRGSMDVLSD